MIAKVEPLTPARALRGPFDYRLPGEMDQVGVGSMLVVPFGRRRLLGVVVDLAEESELPPERLVEALAGARRRAPRGRRGGRGAPRRGGPPRGRPRPGGGGGDDSPPPPARGLALV